MLQKILNNNLNSILLISFNNHINHIPSSSCDIKSSIFSENIMDSDWQSISETCSDDSNYKIATNMKSPSIILK
jgi:hypothetical protein